MQGVSHGPCCRIVDLRCKEVISICDGSRLGYVNDVEIDTCTGRLVAIVVPGRPKLSLLGKREDFVIPWDAIRRIGDDIILTSFSPREGCVQKDCGKEPFFKK
ncbi:MAG: YlmC/YmxH family sporulation protein [Eubacteriales bacterium]|nr:YlmC/YmxH family sporulation protein [Eubacteriales bacterium]